MRQVNSLTLDGNQAVLFSSIWNMSQTTLGNVVAVNHQLAALAAVGIPSNLASGASPATVTARIKQINRSLTLRSDLGQTLLAATIENEELPPVYRSALEAGLRSQHLSATLDGVSRQATADNQLYTTIGRSLIPPLIVSLLAYVGFIVLALYYSPTMASMYEQVDQQPSQTTQWLVALRHWLPFWVPLFPLLVLVAVFVWPWVAQHSLRLIPGFRCYTVAVRNASFAHQLALLVENGLSLEESLPVAAAVTGDKEFVAVAATLPALRAQRATADSNSKALSSLPPFLRWAITGDLGDQSLAEVLRFAEKIYSQSAERRAATWRLVLPTTIGAALGGLIVLAYGLSLFGPFVQLLQDIAS